MKKTLSSILLASSFICTTAIADGMTFQFSNPAFAGGIGYSSHALAVANAINDYEDPDRVAYVAPSEFERLVSTLQSSLMNQLLYDARNGETGYLETDQFKLEVAEDGSGGLLVNIFDYQTGESTSINVNGLNLN